MATATGARSASKNARGGRPGSKSGAIRDYLKKRPDAGPTAVCHALKAKGIAVSPAHVSNVKAAIARQTAGGLGAASSSAKPRGRNRSADAGDAVSISQLIEARKFAAQVGGVERALDLLNSLARLQ